MKLKDFIFSLSFLVLLVFAGSEVLTAQVSSQRMAMSRGNNDAMILELDSSFSVQRYRLPCSQLVFMSHAKAVIYTDFPTEVRSPSIGQMPGLFRYGSLAK